ncbi:hypothetical protein JFL47_13085, partial [Haemophilus haemoglobinophilus]|nr:hypothetical protein [Canicola haemoglobinophilus]
MNSPIENANYGANTFSVLHLGKDDFYHTAKNESNLRFIVEGSSKILIEEYKNDSSPPHFIRSAIGNNISGYGSVLALSEKYDTKRHVVERYRNKFFFGKNSTIETKADYSHGLLLSTYGSIWKEFNEGNQVYVENKGKIHIDGKASAISAFLYRIAAAGSDDMRPLPPIKIRTESERIGNEEIFTIYEDSPNGNFETTSRMIHKEDPNLQGDHSYYITPSAFNSKEKLEQGNNLDSILSISYFMDHHNIGALNTVLELLADAKKNFDPNEKVVEIHNSGELLAPNGYIFSGSMFKDEFHSTSGKLAGRLVLNDGSDEVNLAGTDLASLTELNGAEIIGRKKELKKNVKMTYHQARNFLGELKAERSFLAHYVLVDIPQAVNTLNLDQELTGSSTSNGQANDTKIVNWDIINLGKNAKATLNLTGDLNDGWDEALAGNTDNFDKNSRKKELNIGRLGTVALVNTQKPASIKYDVTNAGTIDLTTNPITEDVLTINGDYKGENATLLVNSLLHNPDYQENDKLVIKGNASGKTTVKAPEGIIGDVTKADKVKNGNLNNPVIEVEGRDNNAFEGKASTTNAGEAQLVKTVTADGKSQYHWTLGLKNDEQEIINTPSTSYVQSQAVARELGFMTLGRLNHRLGELTNSTEPQTWLRTRIEDDSLNGKNRF